MKVNIAKPTSIALVWSFIFVGNWIYWMNRIENNLGTEWSDHKIDIPDGECPDSIQRSESEWFTSRHRGAVHPFWTKTNSRMTKQSIRWWLWLQPTVSLHDPKYVLKQLYAAGVPNYFTKIKMRNMGKCSTCAVVGNSANLVDSNYGEDIDNHDMVIRFNMAPTEGYEKDVGSKTSYRLSYPSSSRDLKPDEHLVFCAFKTLDLKWLLGTITSVKSVTFNVSNVHILHPAFIKYVHDFWMDRHGRYPSTGMLGIAMAFQLCDSVDIYGFGADGNGFWGHYFEKELDKVGFTHDTDAQAILLEKLENEGVVRIHRGLI